MCGVDNPEPQFPFFFYGTLRRGQVNYMLIRGRTVSEFPAISSHKALYSLGSFPFMTEGDGTVHGELVTFHRHTYHEITEILDQLEGYRPEVPSECFYRRVLIPVVDHQGQPACAWAYLGSLDYVHFPLHRIDSGDWLMHRINILGGTRFAKFLSLDSSDNRI